MSFARLPVSSFSRYPRIFAQIHSSFVGLHLERWYGGCVLCVFVSPVNNARDENKRKDTTTTITETKIHDQTTTITTITTKATNPIVFIRNRPNSQQ